MQGEWDEDVERRDLDEEMSQGRRVRLPFFTWRRLGSVAMILAIAAAFVDEGDARPRETDDRTLAGHLGLVETLRFSPDGKTLLTAGWDRTVRIWDVEAAPTAEFGAELACLTVGVEIYAASLSSDGGIVAVAGLDGVTLWNWREDSVPPRTLEDAGPCRSLTFSPDGRTLAVGGFDHQIRIVDVESGRVGAVLVGHADVVRKFAFTPDCRGLISLSYDGRLKCWDLPEGRESTRFHDLDDVTRPILTFALAPAGDVLALSRFNDRSRRIEMWDANRGLRSGYTEGVDRAVHALEFSKDGGVLASSDSDHRIRFWNSATGQAAGALEGRQGWVRTLDFSADGRWIALSSVPDQILLKPIGLPNLSANSTTATIRHEPSGAPGDA